MGDLRIVVVALAAIALAGCAADVDVATPAPTVSATPTPTSTPIAPDPAQLIITGQGIELVDPAGTALGMIVFTGDPADAIARLTSFFGEPAVEVPYGGALEDTPGTDYRWGGFLYRISDHPADPDWYNQSLIVDDPASNGVIVRTRSGVALGSAGSDVQTLAAEPGAHSPELGATIYYTLDRYDRPDSDDPLFTGDLIDSVLVSVSDETGLVDYILAPSPNYGL